VDYLLFPAALVLVSQALLAMLLLIVFTTPYLLFAVSEIMRAAFGLVSAIVGSLVGETLLPALEIRGLLPEPDFVAVPPVYLAGR
jgi:uncharacterized membrane protein